MRWASRSLTLAAVPALSLWVAGCGGRPVSPNPPVPPSPVRPVPPAPPPLGPLTDVETRLLTAHNAARSSAGLAPLAIDARLTVSAAAQAADCARLGRLSHTGADGSNPWQRMTRAGYPWVAASENAAAGQRTPDEAVGDWLRDPPHRANVLGDYRHVGGAVARGADGKLYWVCDYGRPR
jgi:uncharacterized protein YkwD